MVARKKNIKFLKDQVLKSHSRGVRTNLIHVLINDVNGDNDQIKFGVSENSIPTVLNVADFRNSFKFINLT